MLQFGDKTLLQRQLEAYHACGITNISVVRGDKKENINYERLRYYENTDYYKAHRDIAIISIIYLLWEEPKSFMGGNIHLTDYDIEIPLERNQLISMY